MKKTYLTLDLLAPNKRLLGDVDGVVFVIKLEGSDILLID